MSFHEVRLEDGIVTLDTVGGPGFSTNIVAVASGFEQRNQNWPTARGQWELGERRLTRTELEVLTRFFRARKGRAYGFRFKDFGDYKATAATGRLGTAAVGNGTPTYQLHKRYEDAAGSDDRPIIKPVAGSVNVYRSGVPVPFGVATGNCALDTTTGIVTFVADASQNVTAVTVGATTQVTLAAALPTLGIGGRLWLEGLGGTVSAALNGKAHPITGLAGAVYTLSTATTGLAYISGGVGKLFPQATQALTWAGQFDVPVRFDADRIRARFVAYRNEDDEALFDLQSLPVVEDLLEALLPVKNISPALRAHIAQRLTTLATCWKITRRDAQVFRFTSFARKLVVEGETYKSAGGSYSPSQVETSGDLSVDNMDVIALIDSVDITAEDLRAGLFDFAAVEIFEANWADPSMGKLVLRVGTLGEIRVARNVFRAELRGPAQFLQQTIGRVYSRRCGADLGDARCGVNLAAITQAGTVATVANRSTFTASGITGADGHYDGGLLVWTSGLNSGRKMEVKRWTSGAAQIDLNLPMAKNITAGDTFTVYPGCDKNHTTCHAKFSNIVNFRGFPHIPGRDAITRYPDSPN